MYFQKKSKVVVLLAVLLFSIAGLLAAAKVEGGITGAAIGIKLTSITACTGDPATANEDYELANNITATATCLTILAGGVTVNCRGFKIDYGSAVEGLGIENHGHDNVTIKNCLIEETTGRADSHAIYFSSVTNSTIENSIIISKGTNGHGIWLQNSSNNTIRYNNISTLLSSGTGKGIFINGSIPAPINNLLVNNNISSRIPLLHLGEQLNFLIYNNSFGQINWSKTNLTTGINLSVNLNIHLANNVTGFANLPSTTASDQAFNLNSSARIELRGLTYLKTPGLFKNGIRCDNSTTSGFRCSIISYNASFGILDANVSSFSNYSTLFVNVKPLITQLILNTTNIARNESNVNLTAYATTSDADSDSVKVIYNWLRNNTPIAVLNMPFEGVNGTDTNNTWDYSGFANHGNETNGVRWNATGGYDQRGAYMFDGVNDYIFLGNQSSLKSACTDGCTMSAWIRLRGPTSAAATSRSILTRREIISGVTRQFFSFNINPPAPDNQRPIFVIYQNGSSNSLSCVANSLSEAILNDTWTYVAARYNFSHTAVFINGTQVGVSACSFATINIDTWIGGGANIIAGPTSPGVNTFFNGSIDEVMIWNRSLSAEQIWALSQNQTDLIVAQETVRGENWTVHATANDGYEDASPNISNNLTILDLTPPAVNITYPSNSSNFSYRFVDFNATVLDTDSSVDRVIFVFNNRTSPFNVTATNFSGTWSASQVNTSRFAEGLQGVAVSANDSFNNINYTQYINFTVDRTPPNVTRNFVNNPVNDSNFSIRSSNQTFNASIFDVLTGVNRVYFWFDNGTSQDFNVTAVNQSGNWIVSYNVSALAEGRQGLRIVANDTVSNINDSAIINFTVDFTSPNVTRNFLNNPVNDSNFSIRSSNQTFNASIFDVLTQVERVYFWFDNGTSQDFNVTAVNQSGNWIVSYNVSALAEGRQGLRIVANDTVSNINDSAIINFTIDFTSPNVTRNFLNNPVNDSNFSIRSSNQTFNASIFDVLTGVNRVYFWFDNGTSQDFNVTAVNQSGNWIVSYNVSALAEGRQGLRIVANDTVSNINDSAIINFTVDFTAPTVNITAPANATSISGTVSFNARVSDDLTAVNTVLFQFTNSTPFNRTASNSSGTWSVSVNTGAIEEGLITVTVFANDTVGNLNSTQILSLTVDNVAETSGGQASEAVSEPTAPATTPSAPAEAAPAPSAAPETASASEASSAFQSGEASASISSVGGKAITPYASERDYKITITNNLNKKLVLSGALKTKEKEIKLEFEENAKKRLQEELLLEGEIDEAALEEELKNLKLLETIEIFQAHKKLSHFFPEFLVGKAVAPPLIPSKERINGNLLVDVLVNAGELEYIVVNPGETIEKEVKIRRGLSLGQKEPPKIVFSSGGEQILIKDIENHEELVTGTAVDVDPKTKKLDYYMIFAPRPSGGKETFTVEMNINTNKNKLNSQLPLKIKLPFFFGIDSENIYNELLGPYTVNMGKGALIAAQYNTYLPSEYEVITKIFDKEGVVVAENKFEVKQ